MDQTLNQRFSRSSLHDITRLGEFCRKFLDIIEAQDSCSLPQPQLLSEPSSQFAGIYFTLNSPRNSDEIYLEISVLEKECTVLVNFSGFEEQFKDPSDALDFVNDVVNDRIVIVSRYEWRRHQSDSMVGIEDALKMLDENRFRSRGCLDYFSFRPISSIWIKSWTRSGDQNENNL